MPFRRIATLNRELLVRIVAIVLLAANFVTAGITLRRSVKEQRLIAATTQQLTTDISAIRYRGPDPRGPLDFRESSDMEDIAIFAQLLSTSTASVIGYPNPPVGFSSGEQITVVRKKGDELILSHAYNGTWWWSVGDDQSLVQYSSPELTRFVQGLGQ